jgi:hypothetical protein
MNEASLLFDAIRDADAARVREILDRHPQTVHARDEHGATPLHHAAELGNHAIAGMLLDAGADINARDARFGATPAGWAIEYLRMRGAVLGMEIEDVAYAIAKGDVQLTERYLRRLPALRDAVDRAGTPLKTLAAANREIARLFD